MVSIPSSIKFQYESRLATLSSGPTEGIATRLFSTGATVINWQCGTLAGLVTYYRSSKQRYSNIHPEREQESKESRNSVKCNVGSKFCRWRPFWGVKSDVATARHIAPWGKRFACRARLGHHDHLADLAARIKCCNLDRVDCFQVFPLDP